MTSEGTSNPKLKPLEGVAEKFIFEIDGADGPCFIAWVGGMPEREHAFIYRDKDVFFYFYARRTWEGNDVYDVDIENATVSKFTGPTPQIRPEYLGQIARNMRSFFERRMYLDSSEPRPATEYFRNLTFSWKVVL